MDNDEFSGDEGEFRRWAMKRFGEIERKQEENSSITGHQHEENIKHFADISATLFSQDLALAKNTELTAKISKDTSAMLAAWDGGIQTLRVLCRIAAVGRFMWKNLVIPLGLTVVFFYSMFYFSVHREFPSWLAPIAKFFLPS